MSEEPSTSRLAEAMVDTRSKVSTPSVSDQSVLGLQSASEHPKESTPEIFLQLATTSRSELPQTFGRYQVQRKLGSGAMGDVYLARDTLLDRDVAIKTPTFENDEDGELLKRFYREARAASKIKHQNLCSVYDVGEIDGRHYISMEFVSGRNLSAFINTVKTLTEMQAITIVRKIALAMQEAHSHGVIHRDLKPDNIMMNERGEPVVMDFGLVHQMDATNSAKITRQGTLVGSPAYMSKEQIEGDPGKLTAATDQYSLGVLLFQLLTSHRPFEGGLHTVLAAILTKEPPLPSQYRRDLNLRLQAICLKMMAKQPEDRYPSMKAVADALAAIEKEMTQAAGIPFNTAFPDSDPDHPMDDDDLTATLAIASSSMASASTFKANGMPPTEAFPVWRLSRQRLFHYGLPIVLILGAIVVAIRFREPIAPIRRFSSQSAAFPTNGQEKLENLASAGRLDPVSQTEKNPSSPRPSPERGWDGWQADAPAPAIVPFDDSQARSHQEAWAKHLGVPVVYRNSIGMEFALIPPGEFSMGKSHEQIEESLKSGSIDPYFAPFVRSNAPQHNVVLTKPIYFGVHEVTQEQYAKVVGSNPSAFCATGFRSNDVAGIDTDELPVESINWRRAAEFCEKLSHAEGLRSFYDASRLVTDWSIGHGANGYRLPTEAERQFASRAGTNTRYCSGDTPQDLQRVAWFESNSGNRPHPVGRLAPNAFGLYDLHGNVNEWCHDAWDPVYFSRFLNNDAIDPAGPTTGREHGITQGGDFHFTEFNCRNATMRFKVDSHYSDERHGFRVVLTVDAVRLDLKRKDRAE